MTVSPDMEVLAGTRRAWHAVAELLLAGPQYRGSGTIRLRVVPGGFATVSGPELRVEVDHLVSGDGRRVRLSGASIAALGTSVGVDPGGPEHLYRDGSGASVRDVIEVDPVAAGYLASCFERADEALRRLAPEQRSVLWPEHFDLAVTVDEVNYGVSLGDTWLNEPYAYVGPWQPRTGEFWNAPFGAARPLRELPDMEAVFAYFREGRDRAARDLAG